MTPSVTLQFAAKTDTGLLRTHNEDAIAVNADYKMAVLADGMGGYSAGEVASGIATSIFTATLEQGLQQHCAPSSKVLQGLMQASVAAANMQILEAARAQPQFSGMGTTLIAALFHHDRIMLAHMGDSRAYRLRQGELMRLTRDHSQLQEQIDAGLISPEWARFAPNKNLITRALGVAPQIEVEFNDYPLADGDLYLLCSDGLSDMLAHEEMAAICATSLSPPESELDALCETLIQTANDNGGRDNISAIVVKVQLKQTAAVSLWPRLINWLGRAAG